MRRGRAWVWGSVLSRAVVLGAVMLGALWPTYLNLRVAYNNPRLVGLSHGSAWEQFYRANRWLEQLVGQDDLLPGLFSGTNASMTLFGIEFVDPAMVPGVLLAVPGAIAGLWAGMVAVGLVALVTGRGFCAFGCPASLVFSANARLRETIERRWPSLYQHRRALPTSLRVGILLGGTVAAWFSGAWVWQILLPHVLFSTEIVSAVTGAAATFATGLLFFVVAADLLVMPGEVCRSLCPTGLILGRASRVALLQVKAAGNPCPSACNVCTAVCDQVLDPREGTPSDCTLCGQCVVSCPSRRLSIGARLPALRGTAAAALLFMVLPAQAHHYKGLPHYGYFDHYPQTPTDEYIATDGPWEMQFTIYNFQGMEREDVDAPNDVQIFLVVYDLRRKEPFGGNARITIRSKEGVVKAWQRDAEQESIFYIHTPVPTGSDLSLTVELTGPDGEDVVLETGFDLPGEGARNPLVWVGAGMIGLLGLMVVGSKQTRPRRPHKEQRASTRRVET